MRTPVPKEFAYRVEYPTPDSNDSEISRETFSTIDLAARLSEMNEQIESHKSTLIFVNSRTLAEMLGEKLNRLRGDVGVHHGSLPREERERVENAFKGGELKALVCTSTLELGIDIGSVDLVLQYMSPRQVTSLIQRVGRSGHSLKRRSEGVLITVSADDILESVAVDRGGEEGQPRGDAAVREQPGRPGAPDRRVPHGLRVRGEEAGAGRGEEGPPVPEPRPRRRSTASSATSTSSGSSGSTGRGS